MIPGTTAAMMLLNRPAPLPDSSGQFDFVNDTYDWMGSGLSITDVTDKSSWRTSNGLEVPASGASASLIYATTQTFLGTCDWTVVVEIEVIAANDPDVFVVANSGDAFYIELSYFTSGPDEWFLTDTDGGPDRFAEFVSAISNGVHKIAITRSEAKLSISVDGNDTVATTDDPLSGGLPVDGFPMAHFYIGGWGTNNGAMNFRSISFYDAQSDTTLKQLSA